MKKFTIAAATVAALCGTPALAQEETSFGGLYVGVVAGLDHVTIDDGSEDGSKDGFHYGAVAGYDADLGSAVIGAEVELAGSSVKETAANLVTAGDSAQLKAGRDFYAGVRAGFKATPNLLIYAKGGYTNARVILDYKDGSGGSLHGADNLDGFRIGAGVQYERNKIGARLEYRYSDYGDYSFEGVATGLSARRHQVVVTLLTHF